MDLVNQPLSQQDQMEQSLKLPLLSEDKFNAAMNNETQASFDLNLLPCREEEMDEIMNSNIYPSSQNQDAVVLGDSNMLCFGEAIIENLKPHLPLELNIEGVCVDDNGDDVSLPNLNEIQMAGDDGFPLPNLNEGPIEFEEEQSTYTEITECIRDYSNTSPRGCKYEVFLSYARDEDTPKSFALDLYSSLRKDGISILKDEISQSNIEGSEISIIIFTNHYVSSRRCLEELTKIMEFRKSRDHVLLPIFYGLDVYDVCYLESSFGTTFQSEDEGSRWRTALGEVVGIYGFDVPDHIESK